MTRAEIEGVAKGLTGAQRAAIVNAYQQRKPAGGQQFWTVDITGKPWPEGITQYRSTNTDTLTPLGIAVRDFLREGGDGTERA